MNVADEVKALVERIEAMGANVKLGPPSTAGEIAAAEKALGFSLPEEYKEFLLEIGRIEIELVRTWFFYGVPEPRSVKERYEGVFRIFWGKRGKADEAEDAPYVPRRFVVLADEGDFANVGEGFVWDGDLGHIRGTLGDERVEKSDFYEGGYWGFLSDQLEDIHDRIADPEDDLVSGSEAEVARRRKLPA
jgi:hypothetical protein